MSDFDKEAEREKLREKFERDKQKRAQSERMSELLLKGATMTNKHHDCGSPIFRWQGEEFCPSCEGPGSVSTDEGADAREAATEPEPGGPEATGSAGANPTTTDAVDETATADTPEGMTDSTEIGVDAESPARGGIGAVDGTGADEADPTPTRESTRPDRSSRPDRTARAGRATDEGATSSETVAAAGASIERTLADLAREAEETPSTDLSRKRSLVVATREAAETLEAIRRADGQ